jgi:hypothetical protein
MKITVTVSHDFETVQAAMAFAAQIEPITKQLEAPAPSLVAAPVETVEAPRAPAIDREHAETLNPSLADTLPEVKPARKRRTKEEIAADEAAKAAATPAPVREAKPEPIADIDVDFDAPVTPAPAVVSDADLKIAFQEFVKSESNWRAALAEILRPYNCDRVTLVPADKRGALVAAMRARLATA